MIGIKFHLFLVVYLQIYFIHDLRWVYLLNFLLFLLVLFINTNNLAIILRLPSMFSRSSRRSPIWLYFELIFSFYLLNVFLV